MQDHDIVADRAVEWLGPEDPRMGLRSGHPGRIEDPNPKDVFVEWVGLEHRMASRVSYGPESLGPLSDAEFARRGARVLKGDPPLL